MEDALQGLKTARRENVFLPLSANPHAPLGENSILRIATTPRMTGKGVR
ncbi:hypothetical protein [Pararhizobium sp. DWP3-4]